MTQFTINPAWADKIRAIITDPTQDIDEVLSYRPSIQFLITCLANKGRPYRITNMGEGVKYI